MGASKEIIREREVADLDEKGPPERESRDVIEGWRDRFQGRSLSN